jgi:mannose-6-phosphate isomerase-like protein (cupin superfamily)
VTESEYVRSPLLRQVLGSAATDFSIHENASGGDPSELPRNGVPLHRHRSEDEAWYVLEGELAFRFGSREFTVGAGSGVLLPHGTPHTFWNPGPRPVRYLLIVRPKTEALLQALHGPGGRPRESLRELYAQCDVDLLES